MNRRAQLAARVEELAGRRETFVADVRRLAGELDERERLGDILLERAEQEGAFEARLRSRGWLRRQWDRAAAGGR